MHKVIRILVVAGIAFLYNSCKKVDQKPDTKPPDKEIPAGVATKSIKIIFPEGTTIDPATCRIFSLSIDGVLQTDGTYKVPYVQGKPNIAWVFDKDKKVILSGFITDSTSGISTATTAEVLLYLGLGTSFQPFEITQKFVNGIRNVPGVAEWKTEVETMFKNDPLMLSKGLFKDVLKSRVDAIIATGVIKRKPADITVDANDIRSGLQLAESGLSNFTVTNTVRRRAYAFVYKMAYTDTNNVKVSVNDIVDGSDAAISSTIVTPTGAIRDYKGVFQDWIAGKGLEFAKTETGLIEIPLEDNERTADFKVRVIGPGMPVSAPMTTQERERWLNVSLQTALFDFLLPAVLDAIGHNELLGKMNPSLATGDQLKNIEKMLKYTEDIIVALPKASDALEKGDFKTIFTEVFDAIVNNRLGGLTDDFIESIYYCAGNFVMENGSDYYTDPSRFDDRVEDLVAVLEVVDMGLKVIDYGRLTKAIVESKTIESWDLKAREVQVNIDPKEFSVGRNGNQQLKVYIKTDLGKDPPVIEYEWKTEGKYGYLYDDRGHKGKEFTSSLDNLYYQQDSTVAIQGGETDTIHLTTYIKKGTTRTKIGTATAIARITKDEVFTTPLTPNVGIRQNGQDSQGNPLYDAFNPYFTAEWHERKGVKSYSIRIFKDGVFKAPYSYPPSSFPVEDGNVKYTLRIGGLFAKLGMNESQMLEEKARQEKMLADYNASQIEVTVKY